MKWTKKVAFHFIEGLLNAHILYRKEGGKKTLLRFKFDCINVLLPASATDPSAPSASDHFSGHHFPGHPPNTGQGESTEKMPCVHQQQKKEREPISMWGLCTQARPLSSTLLLNLPH